MASFFTDQVFNTREILMEWVQNQARALGYVIIIKRSKTKASGYVSKIILVCDRSGVYKGTSSRDTGTKKINCPFELVANYYKTHNFWTLTVKNGEHNHEPVMFMEGHPFVKKLNKDESRLVAEMTDNNVPPRDILSTLKSRNEHNVSTITNIYNERYKHRSEKRAGRSQMQVVFEILHAKGYTYLFRTDETTNELTDLFFVHPTSLMIWHAFPQVLMMDATYKTNKYNMPLLEIVGVTSTNSTFSIAFVLMDEEKEANYTWALNCLKSTFDGYDGPYVIVTDRELALMNACANVFPTSNRLLCRWHIYECIRKKYSKTLRGTWASFVKAWEKLLGSSSWMEYLNNYANIESILVDYTDVFAYLNRTWLDNYKEMFVSAWTNRLIHFHNHTNNRVESQHSKLKKYLDSNHSMLDRFFDHIDQTVQSQYTVIKANLETSKIKIKHRDKINLFKQLVGEVSHHALKKIRVELDRPNAKNIVEVDCGCQLRYTCGLPCAHEIAIYSNAGQCIPLQSIDTFWRKLDLDSILPSTNYDEPHCEGDIDMFKKSFDNQSKDGKFSYVLKLRDIFSPSSTKVADPIVRINTRGRPRGSTKQTKQAQPKTLVPPIPDPTTEDPRSRSFSTYTPDYMGSNMFDLNQEPYRYNTYSPWETSMFNQEPERHSMHLPRETSMFNQEPERHSTYLPREPSMFNSEPERHNTYFPREPSMFNQQQTNHRSNLTNELMDEIPIEFQPYVSQIHNVDGDGNCGFRAIGVSLGLGENSWRRIRSDLHQELLSHIEDYKKLFGDNDFYSINHSLDFYGTPAIREYWLIMPYSGFLVANRYGVVVQFLSKQGSSTCFPLWSGPENFPNHATIVIALVYGCHYVQVDLLEGNPMPVVCPLTRILRSPHSAVWENMYSARLNAYIPPYRPRSDFDVEIVDIPDY